MAQIAVTLVNPASAGGIAIFLSLVLLHNPEM